MKILGTNSISKYISYFAFLLFLIIAFHLLYELFGHGILYYKYKTGSQIFSNTFILGNEVGWSNNKWTAPVAKILKFKINYPFSDLQVVTGIFGSTQVYYNSFGFLFLSLFFYFTFRCFKEMASEKLFNPEAIKWLKRFGYFNIFLSLISILNIIIIGNLDLSWLFQTFFLSFLGFIILFMVEFFKEGYQLQSENYLTI